MKKINFFAIFILALAFTTTFTSCGGDDQPNDDNTDDVVQYTITVDGNELENGETWTTMLQVKMEI